MCGWSQANARGSGLQREAAVLLHEEHVSGALFASCGGWGEMTEKVCGRLYTTRRGRQGIAGETGISWGGGESHTTNESSMHPVVGVRVMRLGKGKREMWAECFCHVCPECFG